VKFSKHAVGVKFVIKICRLVERGDVSHFVRIERVHGCLWIYQKLARSVLEACTDTLDLHHVSHAGDTLQPKPCLLTDHADRITLAWLRAHPGCELPKDASEITLWEAEESGLGSEKALISVSHAPQLVGRHQV
jgi:hypothetical protein